MQSTGSNHNTFIVRQAYPLSQNSLQSATGANRRQVTASIFCDEPFPAQVWHFRVPALQSGKGGRLGSGHKVKQHNKSLQLTQQPVAPLRSAPGCRSTELKRYEQ
jgi:hypothetical protein